MLSQMTPYVKNMPCSRFTLIWVPFHAALDLVIFISYFGDQTLRSLSGKFLIGTDTELVARTYEQTH